MASEQWSAAWLIVLGGIRPGRGRKRELMSPGFRPRAVTDRSAGNPDFLCRGGAQSTVSLLDEGVKAKRTVKKLFTGEVAVLVNQDLFQCLADRIERSYRLRWTLWQEDCAIGRVWDAAAANLVQVHQEDPMIPLDPELFVAAQEIGPNLAYPWSELTQVSSALRYRRCVREIIRSLAAELRGEVRRVEAMLRDSQATEKDLLSKSRTVSPLACFIAAERAGREDLVKKFRAAAIDQHRACPLYRWASFKLIAPGSYPAQDEPTDPAHVTSPARLAARTTLSRN